MKTAVYKHFVLLFGLAPAVVFAQSDTEEKAAITVTAKDCQRLIQHVPADDVNYTPGVDVYGNPVVGADLHDNSALLNALPKEIEIPITMNPIKHPSFANSDMTVGTVKYDIINNRATFNGVPLTDEEQAELAKACREAGFK